MISQRTCAQEFYLQLKRLLVITRGSKLTSLEHFLRANLSGKLRWISSGYADLISISKGFRIAPLMARQAGEHAREPAEETLRKRQALRKTVPEHALQKAGTPAGCQRTAQRMPGGRVMDGRGALPAVETPRGAKLPVLLREPTPGHVSLHLLACAILNRQEARLLHALKSLILS